VSPTHAGGACRRSAALGEMRRSRVAPVSRALRPYCLRRPVAGRHWSGSATANRLSRLHTRCCLGGGVASQLRRAGPPLSNGSWVFSRRALSESAGVVIQSECFAVVCKPATRRGCKPSYRDAHRVCAAAARCCSADAAGVRRRASREPAVVEDAAGVALGNYRTRPSNPRNVWSSVHEQRSRGDDKPRGRLLHAGPVAIATARRWTASHATCRRVRPAQSRSDWV
jgi:hypothetical protein